MKKSLKEIINIKEQTRPVLASDEEAIDNLSIAKDLISELLSNFSTEDRYSIQLADKKIEEIADLINDVKNYIKFAPRGQISTFKGGKY